MGPDIFFLKIGDPKGEGPGPTPTGGEGRIELVVERSAKNLLIPQDSQGGTTHLWGSIVAANHPEPLISN